MIIKKYEVDANIKVLFDYWYLEEISCIPIYRNQEWFNEAKVKLEEFWLKVLKYRELGLDKLKEELKDEKLNKKRDKEIIRDEKNKVKEDGKKQKKMKDYIILDDENTTINKEIIDKTDKTDKINKSSKSEKISKPNKSSKSNNIDDNNIILSNTSLFSAISESDMNISNIDDNISILSSNSLFS